MCPPTSEGEGFTLFKSSLFTSLFESQWEAVNGGLTMLFSHDNFIFSILPLCCNQGKHTMNCVLSSISLLNPSAEKHSNNRFQRVSGTRLRLIVRAGERSRMLSSAPKQNMSSQEQFLF